ncbi:autotransporter assembly complex family protein [Thalassotalea sp. PS06]|uniref:autotransporter assembly complex protein TamA n=1 Tax=Thalassotalea sp. PS06 TaxID=2594005 RepID=UPI00163DDB81|nr:autotransporter assembly complex family protein [Thalassotalea sp. PS06]
MFSGKLVAANLQVKLPDDLPQKFKRNIRAHLGELPDTETKREGFVFTAEDKTTTALQAMGYYRSEIDVRIDKDVVKDDEKIWRLHIDVVLNEPTRYSDILIDIQGEAELDSQFVELVTEIQTKLLKSNDIVDHSVYESVKSKISNLALDRGYFEGRYLRSRLAIQEDYTSADVELVYLSGRRYYLGEVIFSEFDLDPELLEVLIPFDVGEPYTSQKLLQFQSLLQQTQYFGNLLVVPDLKNPVNQLIPVNVTLGETKSHYVDVGFGFATDTLFRVSTSWRTPKINSKGHSQETRFEYSQINPTGRFTYRIPLSDPLKDLLQLQLTFEDDEYGGLVGKYLEGRIANVRIYERWSAQYYTRFLAERWRIEDLPKEIAEDEVESGSYLMPGVIFSRTSRKGPQLDPSWGFSQYYMFEGGAEGAGSDISILRAIARWRFITTPTRRHRLVFRAEVGISDIFDAPKSELAPSLRFFAGGDLSIRGFDYQSQGPTQIINEGEFAGEEVVVGGKRIALASAEYQYYFTDKIRGVVFTDAGNATDDIRIDPVYSVGFGAHYISPVGAIRVDFGYGISEDDPSWKIHINLGAEL